MDATGLAADEARPEERLRAAEALAAEVDVVPAGQLVELLNNKIMIITIIRIMIKKRKKNI